MQMPAIAGAKGETISKPTNLKESFEFIDQIEILTIFRIKHFSALMLKVYLPTLRLTSQSN